jgi:RimJ/RimL family protein N-acetyltransferase
VLFRKELAPSDEDPFAETEFQIRRMPIEELQATRKNVDLPREFYCDVSHGWKTCYVITRRAEIAYIHWVCSPAEQSRFFRCQRHVAEVNYVITLPPFRGRGLAAKAIQYSCNVEQTRGVKALVIAVHSKNTIMRKCMKKVGFKKIGTVKTLGQLNRKTTVDVADG